VTFAPCSRLFGGPGDRKRTAAERDLMSDNDGYRRVLTATDDARVPAAMSLSLPRSAGEDRSGHSPPLRVVVRVWVCPVLLVFLTGLGAYSPTSRGPIGCRDTFARQRTLSCAEIRSITVLPCYSIRTKI